MGELTNFHINDDGSVTVAQHHNLHETNILDIFRIEKAKGGVFASRRMKRRAQKYALHENISEHQIDKLMLDNYPNDFNNYRRTTWLIAWSCIIVIFLITAIISACKAYETLGEMLLWFPLAIVCLTISCIGIWQYQRIRTKIRQQSSITK